MSGYIGPLPVPQGIQRKQSFTATAGQTTFNTNGYTDGNFITVYLNGVRLINGTDYTATNGSDVVLTSAAAASDVLDFETFQTFSLVDQTFDNVTLKNPTHEDTDGGRESAVSFKGEQSGGEISTLAAIQASHDGTSDDQKGDLIFKTNDGSDNNAPTERLRINSDGAIDATSTDQDGFFFRSSHSTNTNFYVTNTNATTSNTASLFLAPANNVVGAGLTALAIEDFSTSANRTADLLVKTRKDGTLAETWRFTKDGHFKAATNGNGIDFSATEGSATGTAVASSILHDYEEGTWTPIVNFTTTTDTTHSRQVGSYTKIGEFVYCDIAIIFTKGSSAGSMVLDGFPYPVLARNSNDRGTGAVGYFDGTNAIVPLVLMDGNTTTRATFYNATDGSDPGHRSLNNGDFGTGDINFHISITYKTAS